VIAPEEYRAAETVLLALLPAMFFQGLESFGKTLLHVKRRSCVTGAAAATGAAACLALNALLVPGHGWRGAVAASGAATALAAGLVMLAALRTYPVRLERGRVGVGLAGLALLAAAFALLRDASAAVCALVTVPSAAVATGALCLGGFFDPRELAFAKAVLARLALAIGLRREAPP
jgi:O-antigen/teichoic acid export membrane protein